MRQRLRALARIFDYLPVGFCVFDMKRRYVYVNQALADSKGLAIADHIGRTVSEILPIIGPDAERGMDEVLATDKPVIGGARRPGAPTKYMATPLSAHAPARTSRPIS